MSNERDSTGAVLVDPLGGLVLDPPNELRFKGPFDDYVTVSLTIKNPTEKRIAFKIKTTAPKKYCVKPNSGVLDPTQTMKVNVLLQPFNYDPSEKNKHKFMVQYLYLNDEEMQLSVNDILNMWKDVPSSRLLDLKLKCLFEFNDVENQKVTQQQDKPAALSQQQQKPLSNSSQNNSTNVSSSVSSRQTTAAGRTSGIADVSSSNDTTNLNDYETALNNTTINNTKLVNNTTSSNVVNNNNSNSTSGAAARVEKNDNTLNELKLARQENEILKKEVNRLKEEEARLRKLALQSSGTNRSSPSSSSSSASSSLEINSLADLLNNRLVLIIIVLTAIIVYLLLFR